MKHLFYPLFVSILCMNALVAQNSLEYTNQTHSLDITKSSIHWKGYYLFKMAQHEGTVSFEEGSLFTVNGDIKGGSFIIDMTSITNPDYEDSGNGPVEHLKDPDFFHVKKFPKAMLEITAVEYYKDSNDHRFYANLTIKGITKPVEFIAKVDSTQKTMHTQFKIDRTRWGITYNHDVKDSAISDGIEFDVFLQF